MLRLPTIRTQFPDLAQAAAREQMSYRAFLPAGVDAAANGLAGDGHIQAVIDLPHPCKQPIIFVAAPTGQWFAESNADAQP